MVPDQNKQYLYKPIQIILYFVLTFLISWSFMIPWAKGSQGEGSLALPCAGYGPFLAAVIVVWISKGGSGLLRWFKKAFWPTMAAVLFLAVAFLLPFVIGGLQYGIYRVLGGETDFSAVNPWNLYVANLAVIFLLYGGNEEPGWRGFALPALLERFHPLLATLILGIIHSAWHLPMLGSYGDEFGWYLFNLIPLTVIFNWFPICDARSVKNKAALEGVAAPLTHNNTCWIRGIFPFATRTGQGACIRIRSVVGANRRCNRFCVGQVPTTIRSYFPSPASLTISSAGCPNRTFVSI